MNAIAGFDSTDGGRRTSVPARGLCALEKIKLSASNRRLLKAAHNICGGPPAWRYRKLAEAFDVLALSEIASRFKVEFLDVRESLRAVVYMKVPVACMSDADTNLRIDETARLGIIYPEQALRMALPGYSFVEILQPTGVWHANVSSGGAQRLCLGTQLPVGTQLKDIVLMTYGALSFQTVMIDELDAAGVLNPEAARWWQHNLELIPLSREPFLDIDKLAAG